MFKRLFFPLYEHQYGSSLFPLKTYKKKHVSLKLPLLAIVKFILIKTGLQIFLKLILENCVLGYNLGDKFSASLADLET